MSEKRSEDIAPNTGTSVANEHWSLSSQSSKQRNWLQMFWSDSDEISRGKTGICKWNLECCHHKSGRKLNQSLVAVGKMILPWKLFINIFKRKGAMYIRGYERKADLHFKFLSSWQVSSLLPWSQLDLCQLSGHFARRLLNIKLHESKLVLNPRVILFSSFYGCYRFGS